MHANELKVVIFHKKDLEWALEYAGKVKPDCELYLQPEWSKEKEMLPQIIDFVKANPRWKISLQVHKYMNIP
jgi:7-carboxy-7-deazaguanine synthase